MTFIPDSWCIKFLLYTRQTVLMGWLHNSIGHTASARVRVNACTSAEIKPHCQEPADKFRPCHKVTLRLDLCTRFVWALADAIWPSHGLQDDSGFWHLCVSPMMQESSNQNKQVSASVCCCFHISADIPLPAILLTLLLDTIRSWLSCMIPQSNSWCIIGVLKAVVTGGSCMTPLTVFVIFSC